jgi:phosphoribosylamine--glycine ligase
MQKYGIPCAQSVSFSDYQQAKEYVQRKGMPLVIKADGLAAGKGVTVADTIPQALEALVNIMELKIKSRG